MRSLFFGAWISDLKRAGTRSNVFKNNDIAELREITDTELVLNDDRRMRRHRAHRPRRLHYLVRKPMPYGRPGRRVAGRR